MITFNGKEFRNLVEQVLKNQKDIESINDINRSLADYGIKIIGFYETIEDAKEDLGDPYEGPYGNAVGIGSGAPYDFYIWTRANNLSEVDYWQDVGTLAVLGPEGPQGEQGIQGEPGQPARIFTGTNLPTISGTENDIYLCVGGDNNLIGNVYKIKNGTWQLEGNVRGPQGIQGNKGNDGGKGDTGERGERGPAGDPGGFIKISGILENSEQLPNPTVLEDLEVAYLVGENKDLWMQIGTTYDNAIWTNIGPLNVATYVSVDGQYQNTWDADTKLDKYTHAGEDYYLVYGMNYEGNDTMFAAGGSELGAGAIAMYDGNNCLTQDTFPELPEHVVNKDYLDSYIKDSDTITIDPYYDDTTNRGNLKLHLNANLVADITKSIKTPTAPAYDKSLPLYNNSTGDIEWISNGTWVSATSAPKYGSKTAGWSPQSPLGQKYEVFAYDSGTPSFDITVTKPDNTQSTLTGVQYAIITCVGSGWIHIMAFASSTMRAHLYAKAINNITKSKVFAIRYTAATIY